MEDDQGHVTHTLNILLGKPETLLRVTGINGRIILAGSSSNRV
jgi:hypothetical protein